MGTLEVHSASGNLKNNSNLHYEEMMLNEVGSAMGRLRGIFMGAQGSLHPILYFLALGWIQKSGMEMPAVLTLTFGVFSTCVHGINPLFMFSPWSRDTPLTSLTLIPCLLSCTSREKLALFSLAFTRSCFTDEISRTGLLFLWSVIISSMVLKQLCFCSKRDNKLYFIGFCITAAYSSIKLVRNIFGWNVSLLFEVVMLVAVLSLGEELMGRRMRQLEGSNAQEMQYEGEMRIYLENMGQMLGNTIMSQTVMVGHKKLCIKADCFCSRNNSNKNNVAFLKQLYELFLARLQGRDDGLIRQKYVQYHLQQSQIINAVWQLKRCKPKSYFQRASLIRMYSKINTWNKNANSGNVFGKQFQYGQKFDGILMELAKRAVEVIKLKKRFWMELGRQSPRVGLLQKTGNDAVKYMYDLNHYYAREVKLKEQKLSLLDGTALYAVYLLSTTNFREYAESLIKASAKTMEEARLFDCAQTETYAISAEVHSPSLSFLENAKSLSMNQKQSNHNKELIIRSVSLGLCRTLGYEKDELLGKQLNTMIPIGYKQVHNVRLSKLLDFESNQEVTPSKVLHRELTLPMKGAGRRIVVGKILIKINPNSKNQLSFISVIRLLNTRTKSALLDDKGNVTQFQQGFDESLLQHSQVQRYYQRAIQTWLQEGTILEQRFNIIVNASNYTVCMSSPLLILFIDKGKLVQSVPPIHIEITNEISNRRVRTDRDGRIGNQFNKMEAVLNIQAQSSTASSKSSTSAVNILSAFSQTYSTIYYRLLQGIFFVAMLICTGCSIGAHYSSGLQWISSWRGNNPINDTMNFYSLHMLTVKMLIMKGDIQTYYDSGIINRTTVDSYFPNGEFKNYSQLATLNIENAFKQSIYNCLKSQSVIEQSMKQKLEKILDILNPYSFSSLGSITATYQQMTYLQILMLFASDANLIAKRKTSILGYAYSVQISQWQNSTKFQLLINEKINSSANLSLTLHFVFIAIVIALIIPLFFLLRKRAQEHTVVFDILASVESGMTSKEVDSLKYVQNILTNFKEADSTLKNNVMDYQVNALMPKGPQQRRASAENELIIGLEEYDRANIQHSKYDSFDSKGISKQKFAEKSSFLTFVRKGFNSVKQQRTLRRRDGEIDLTDSWMDPSKKVIASHLLLYVLVGLSATILLLGLVMNRQFTSALQQAKTLLFALYQQQVLVYNTIITNNVLTGQGVDFLSKFFGIPDVLSMIIVPLNQYFPYFDYTHDFPVPQIPQCTGLAQQKLCKFKTNQIILKSQLGSVLKDIVQLRYNYDKGKIPFNWTKEQAYTVIKQKDLYADSILYKLQEIGMQQISYISDRINEEAIKYSSRKSILLLLGLAWIIFATILGLWVILRQKQRYFREVFLITFLNREMITKNKRVQSFLERLARNNGV